MVLGAACGLSVSRQVARPKERTDDRGRVSVPMLKGRRGSQRAERSSAEPKLAERRPASRDAAAVAAGSDLPRLPGSARRWWWCRRASFMMGSPEARGRDSDEGPQRKVTIARPFAVGKFEVTFAEWDACVAAGGCKHQPDDKAGAGAGGR